MRDGYMRVFDLAVIIVTYILLFPLWLIVWIFVPRPERPALAEQFNREVCGFSRRLRVRPGIAGLAQVRGSYWTDPSYKLKYDNLYIETMNPWLDIKLQFLAVWVAIKRVLSGSESSVIEP